MGGFENNARRESQEQNHGPENFTLKTAFQTAKYTKYAKGEGVEQESVFIQLVNRAFSPTHSVLAYFAYFAVPTSFSGFTNAECCSRKLELAFSRLRLSVEGVLLGIPGRDRQFNWLFHKHTLIKDFYCLRLFPAGVKPGISANSSQTSPRDIPQNLLALTLLIV